MKIIKNYREDAALRQSFNALAEETFGLNFENWYQMGYWTDAYTPYSVVEEGTVVANVSLNRTDMLVEGKRLRLYQLGTVMTKPAYRNRGYIRAIMAEIEKDTEDADGMYLFANDEVLNFYPKFGFAQEKEYVYTREVPVTGENRAVQVSMADPEKREKLYNAIMASTFSTGCHMVDNPGLIFFYAAQFMQECVYCLEDTDTWVIAEAEDGVLTLHNVFSAQAVSLEDVIGAFGGIREVVLGFTPAESTGFTCRKWKEEDCTFFVKGEAFQNFGERKLRIPSLSHA